MIAPAEHAALLSLLDQHEAMLCGDVQAHKDGSRPLIEARLGLIHQTVKPMDAAVWECKCGWARSVRLSLPTKAEPTVAVSISVPV